MTNDELRRFNSKWEEDESGCWQWEDSLATAGYGTMWLPSTRDSDYAHRISYSHFKGPIPKKLQIDHLCRNRGCVNPNHLELVTQRENLLRGENEKIKVWREKVCQRGHALVGENYVEIPATKTRRGGHYCRACFNARARSYYAKNPEKYRALSRANQLKARAGRPCRRCKRWHLLPGPC